MSDSVSFSFSNGSGRVATPSLSAPFVSAQWARIFDLLSVIPLQRLCGFETTSAYARAKSGVIDSYSFRGFYSYPKSDSFINYGYAYHRGHVAALELKVWLDADDPGARGFTNIDATVADPEWMLLLFIAQRQARANRQRCELCGQPFNKIERFRKLWHHRACQRYQPYTAAEEYPRGNPIASPSANLWD